MTFDGVIEVGEPGQTLVDLAAGTASLVERFGPTTAALVQRIGFTASQEVEFELLVADRAEKPLTEGESDPPAASAASAPGVVRFGRLEEVPEKLLAMETWLSQYGPSCLFELDVRVPRSPTAVHDSLC